MIQPPRASLITTAAVVDAAAVVVFVVIGRRSHAEGLDVVGIASTAWPFLAGLALGWLLTRAWRRPLAVWPTGVVIWAVTVGGGLVLRAAAGQGIELAFVMVAAVVLATLLIGWRLVTALVRRLTARRADAKAADAKAAGA
jgi:hypothetical protein